MFHSFKYFFSYYFVAATIFLISVDVLVGGLIKDGCWIICWDLLGKSKTDRLIVTGSCNGDCFGVISVTLVGGKYCRIDLIVCLCLLDVFLLLLILFYLCCWWFVLFLFVVCFLLVSFSSEVSKISNRSFIVYYLRTFICFNYLQIFINGDVGSIAMRWKRRRLCIRWRS